MIEQLFYKLSGGRPMSKVIYAFRDVVKHEPVFIFEDHFGRYWMANNRWSLFRVRTQHGPDIWNSGSGKVKG